MTSPAQEQRPRAALEAQQKFRVHGLYQLPDLHSVDGVGDVAELGTTELTSVYFDTADLRLAREGITLRRRTGDDEGWQLKVPAHASAPGLRTEVWWPLTDDDSPPADLVRVVRVVVRSASLVHAATLRTHRTTLVLHDPDGKPVVDLVDDTVHVVKPDGTATARFREIELEDRNGGAVLTPVADALVAAGAVGGEFMAKLIRALGPAATAPSEVAEPTMPGPDDPAADAARAYLATQVRALRAADIAFRCDPAGAGEAVHQMRVAARRLRAALRTFQAILDAGWAARLRDELAWLADGLRELREQDVLRARLLDDVSRLPSEIPASAVRRVVEARFDAGAATAREAAVAHLDASRYIVLHEALVEAAREPAFAGDAAAPARDVLPALVEKAWRRLRRAADDLTADSPADEWHRVRLLAKRTRYAAEAATAVLGEPARRFAREMERLTDLLGDHQDAVQAAAVSDNLAARGLDAPVTHGLAMLAGRQREQAASIRAGFGTIWPTVRDVALPV